MLIQQYCIASTCWRMKTAFRCFTNSRYNDGMSSLRGAWHSNNIIYLNTSAWQISVSAAKLMHQIHLYHMLTGYSLTKIISQQTIYFISHTLTHARTHTQTHPFNGPFSGTTPASRYQKGKTNLDFTEASDSDISWAICKSAPWSRQKTTPALHHTVFLQAGCPSCRPTNSVKALLYKIRINHSYEFPQQNKIQWNEVHQSQLTVNMWLETQCLLFETN